MANFIMCQVWIDLTTYWLHPPFFFPVKKENPLSSRGITALRTVPEFFGTDLREKGLPG
jgi:hypothetical protein